MVKSAVNHRDNFLFVLVTIICIIDLANSIIIIIGSKQCVRCRFLFFPPLMQKIYKCSDKGNNHENCKYNSSDNFEFAVRGCGIEVITLNSINTKVFAASRTITTTFFYIVTAALPTFIIFHIFDQRKFAC